MNDGRDELGRFVKGRKVSDEDMLKKVVGLSESWKNRPNYIGDIKQEAPYIHSVWRAMRTTQKGKKIGNCERWNNFRNFYNDVRPSYKKGLVFRRLDIKDNYNPNNFIWVTTEEAALLQSNLVWLEYEGQEYTLKQLADKFNQSVNGLKIRYHNRSKKNYTTEEIIFGRKKKRHSKTPKDYTETNSRTKASKMISSYRKKDQKNGVSICDITIDWMIDNILTKPCVYCGDTYRVGCDRLDNSKGHTIDNVVPCCYECNCARNNNFSHQEMKIIGETIKKVKQQRNVDYGKKNIKKS